MQYVLKIFEDIKVGARSGTIFAPAVPQYGHAECVGPSNCFGYYMCQNDGDMRV
jgi:hypothetical protein